MFLFLWKQFKAGPLYELTKCLIFFFFSFSFLQFFLLLLWGRFYIFCLFMNIPQVLIFGNLLSELLLVLNGFMLFFTLGKDNFNWQLVSTVSETYFIWIFVFVFLNDYCFSWPGVPFCWVKLSGVRLNKIIVKRPFLVSFSSATCEKFDSWTICSIVFQLYQ